MQGEVQGEGRQEEVAGLPEGTTVAYVAALSNGRTVDRVGDPAVKQVLPASQWGIAGLLVTYSSGATYFVPWASVKDVRVA